MSSIPRALFLNVARDKQGRVWGIARICLADGSCLVVESRVYRGMCGEGVLGGDDEDSEPSENRALDEALDKLCKITDNKVIMRAIPLPARVALKLVCTVRNLKKIKEAAENEGDDELAGRAHAKLRRFARSDDEQAQRAYNALRLWR